MYNQKDTKHKFVDAALGLVYASTGTWTAGVATDVLSYDKQAADNTPVLEGSISSFVDVDARVGTTIEYIVVYYSVATAALEAAPTLEFHKTTFHATTHAPTATTVAGTATSGTNGTAVGSYAAVYTPASDLVLNASQRLTFELTANAATTSVFKVIGYDIVYTTWGEY